MGWENGANSSQLYRPEVPAPRLSSDKLSSPREQVDCKLQGQLLLYPSYCKLSYLFPAILVHDSVSASLKDLQLHQTRSGIRSFLLSMTLCGATWSFEPAISINSALSAYAKSTLASPSLCTPTRAPCHKTVALAGIEYVFQRILNSSAERRFPKA
jgi:hypothetical protein